MKNSPGWDLLSMVGVSAEKIQKNLKEVSIFLNNDVSNIIALIDRFQPLELVKMACWERRRVFHDRPNDEFAQRTASRLVWYLQSVVGAKKPPFSQNTEIKEGDWKRLVTLFDDLCRKTIKYTDNYALSLYADQVIGQDELLILFQDYATDSILPSVFDKELLKKQHNGLKYQLQPFNSLIAEVFDAKLDELLLAFVQLATTAHEGIDKLREDSTVFKQASMLQLEVLKSQGVSDEPMQALMDRVVKEQGWESWIADIVGKRDGYDLFDVRKITDLSVSDALSLAIDAGQNSEFLLSDTMGWLTKESSLTYRPFLRISNTILCFDGDTLLDRAYWIIRSAVCAKAEGYEARWRAIEEEKQSLLPITFFSAMLGTMNYTRKVLHGDGYIDAVFEDSQRSLSVQVPASHLGFFPYHAFEQTEDALLQLEGELDAIKLLDDLSHPCVVVDITGRDSDYPLALKENKLFLSFVQLADIATTWDGMAKIKSLLGIPTFGQEEHHKEAEAPEVQEYESSGYESLDDDLFDEDDFQLHDDGSHDEQDNAESAFSYFDEIEEDEKETAEDFALSVLQQDLFDFEDELKFSQGNLVENTDLDDDDMDEYEHEALCIIEDHQVDENLPKMGSSLVQADEQMEGDLEDDSKLYDYTQYNQESEDEYRGEDEQNSPSETPKEKPSSPISFFAHLSSIAKVPSTKAKEPTITDSLEEAEPTIADALEEAEPTIADALEEAEPTIADALEEAEPTIADALEEAEPTIADALEEAEPTIADALEEAEPTIAEALEETEPTKEPVLSNRWAMPPDPVEPESMEPDMQPLSRVQSPPRFILAEMSKKGESVPVAEEKEPIRFQELESSLDASLPKGLRDILGKLEEKEHNGFFDFCKTAEEALLKTTASLIEQARQAQLVDSKDKMFTIPGFDLTVVLITGRSDMLRSWDRKNNVAAIMYNQGKTSWEVLYLAYTPSGSLSQAEERSIQYEDFSATDWKYVVNIGERMKERKKREV